MTEASGWGPEPIFGDALAGSGGMAEPVQPNLFLAGGTSEVFPDALSGVITTGTSATAAAPVPAVHQALVPAAFAQTAPGGRPAQSPPRRPPPARGASPVPPPRGASAVPPPRPWSQLPLPGRPPAVPTVTPLARNPGVGRSPVPGAPAGNASLIRPPAYLPPTAGLAQIRSALQQARRSAVDKPNSARMPAGRKGSVAWSLLLALVIVLVASGVAEKIITAISHLLQGN